MPIEFDFEHEALADAHLTLNGAERDRFGRVIVRTQEEMDAAQKAIESIRKGTFPEGPPRQEE